MKIFFENFRKNTCIFEIDVLIYAGRVSDEVNIRVWRSLVSRLNGVQEASSSNLDTRTKKWETTYVVSHFLFRRKRFEPSNASVRWTLACRQLDGGNTMIFIPVGNENEPNLDTRTLKLPCMLFCCFWVRLFAVCNAQKIIRGCFIQGSKCNQHIHGNLSAACFVLGIGVLSDVQIIRNLLLGEIVVFP